MGKLLRSQLYVMLHSRACLLLLLSALLLTALIYRDNGDVMDEREMARYVDDLQERMDREGQSGDAFKAAKEHWHLIWGLEGETPEELAESIRDTQLPAAPELICGCVYTLLLLLPGATLSPALSKQRGIQRELERYGRVKPLLSRMLLSWVFCLLVSTVLYILFLRHYTNWETAPHSQMLRNWLVVQLCALANVCYSYLVYVLLRKAWLAAPAMVLADSLLHRVIPGLRAFYPWFLVPPSYSIRIEGTMQFRDSLVSVVCPPGELGRYILVCAAYTVGCTALSLLLFRRRDIQ